MTPFHDPDGAALGFWLFALLLGVPLAVGALHALGHWICRACSYRAERGEFEHQAMVSRAKRKMADDLR